mmetsp:Transcript_64958/g.152845  ORF Transcript_64958/g.152845 Transcript_64958/m.152845 type:complete len:285 (-) Transcript_64958:62-916(-)
MFLQNRPCEAPPRLPHAIQASCPAPSPVRRKLRKLGVPSAVIAAASALASRRAAAPHALRKARIHLDRDKALLRAVDEARLVGYLCGLSDLDFRLRAVPGEVTYVDPAPTGGGHGGPITAADAEAAVSFVLRWVSGLAKEADWHFNVQTDPAEDYICELQNCGSRETPALEVPWILEHFQTFPNIDGLTTKTPTGVLLRSEDLPHKAYAVGQYLRNLRRSNSHTWILRSNCEEEQHCALQNYCDNNICVWAEDENSRDGPIRVKVCSMRNHLAGNGSLCSFVLP